jgi:hypothetical protein
MSLLYDTYELSKHIKWDIIKIGWMQNCFWPTQKWDIILNIFFKNKLFGKFFWALVENNPHQSGSLGLFTDILRSISMQNYVDQ